MIFLDAEAVGIHNLSDLGIAFESTLDLKQLVSYVWFVHLSVYWGSQGWNSNYYFFLFLFFGFVEHTMTVYKIWAVKKRIRSRHVHQFFSQNFRTDDLSRTQNYPGRFVRGTDQRSAAFFFVSTGSQDSKIIPNHLYKKKMSLVNKKEKLYRKIKSKFLEINNILLLWNKFNKIFEEIK